MSVPHVESWQLTAGFDHDAPQWRYSRVFRSVEDVEVPGVNDPLPRCEECYMNHHVYRPGCVHYKPVKVERGWS